MSRVQFLHGTISFLSTSSCSGVWAFVVCELIKFVNAPRHDIKVLLCLGAFSVGQRI